LGPQETASASWIGAEVARIRATVTATRAASRLMLTTLEGKKEVPHTTLAATQQDIKRQRAPIDKASHCPSPSTPIAARDDSAAVCG